MKTIIKRYIERRAWAANWASAELRYRRAYAGGWWSRHLAHHRTFRSYMRRAAALQKEGYRL